METSDIFLGLVTIIVAMLGWFLNRLANTVQELEQNIITCQTGMPKEYVLKADYERQQDNIEKKLDKIYDKIDNLIKKN